MPVAAYLARLGLGHLSPDADLPASLETLRLLHRRHLATVPYENLGTMLGTPPSVDPESSLTRIGDLGRAGYCFHHNAVLELALRELGFRVERHHGHVWTRPELRDDTVLNHLALVVHDLPTLEHPDGRWWADVGLGEGFLEPLPLRAGTYDDGPLRFTIDEVTTEGWRFTNDASGTFAGLAVTPRPTGPMALLDAHARLTAPGSGVFTRVLVVQRRDRRAVHTLRGCVRTRVDVTGTHVADLTSYDAWRAALLDLRLTLDGVDEGELRGLFDRTLVAHEAWVAAGRP